MTHPISIENEYLRVQVYPGYGSKVTSVIDKADRFDLLFSYPCALPTSPHYDVDYGAGWYAGWDECFPGIAPGPYPGHPYEGVGIPDHGELWGLPTMVQPSSEGILSRWHGIRFGYHFTRHLRLIGDTLEAKYAMENTAPFDFHFVWAMHSLMTMTLPVEFEFEGDANWRLSHGSGGAVNQAFGWPSAGEEDASKPSAMSAGHSWKLFSMAAIDRPFKVSYPTRKRTLTIGFEGESGLAGYWGVWINNGGWAGHKHFAIEPTLGRYDQLENAVRDGSAAEVGPMGKAGWTVRWRVG